MLCVVIPSSVLSILDTASLRADLSVFMRPPTEVTRHEISKVIHSELFFFFFFFFLFFLLFYPSSRLRMAVEERIVLYNIERVSFFFCPQRVSHARPKILRG